MTEMGWMALGAALCAFSVILLLGLMAVVILDGEQRLWGGAGPQPAFPGEGFLDDRPQRAPRRRMMFQDYRATRRPRMLGVTVLVLILASFVATAVWLTTYGLTALGLGSAVDAAVVALKR